ncbi:MAG: hypothetical protein AB8G15_18940 [Saprospiraceae bacterium]
MKHFSRLLFLVLYCSFFTTTVFSQGINITEITPPSDTDQWSICDGVGGLFTIRTVGFSSGTNVSLSIGLQPGMEYIQSGPDSLPSNIGTSTNPSFTLPDYTVGEERFYTFRITTNCTTLNYLLGPPSEEANLVFTLNADEANNVITTADSPFQPFTSSIKIPFLIPQPINNIIGVITEVNAPPFEREFEIVQSGVNAALNEFVICMNYGTGINVSNQQLNNVNLTLDGSNCFTINATNAATYGITLPMGTGSRYSWTEDVVITDCDHNGGQATVEWGCEGTACSNQNLNMEVIIDEAMPSFSYQGYTTDIGSCIDDGALVEFEWSLDSGKIYDLGFELTRRNSGWIDPNSIQIDTGTGSWINVLPASFSASRQDASALSGCAPSGDAYTQVTFPAAFGPIEGPRTIKVRATSKFCCTGDCSPANTQIFGLYADLIYNNSCGITIRDNNRSNNPINLAASTSDNIPASIDDGDTLRWVLDLDFAPEWTTLNFSGEACLDIHLDAPLAYQGNFTWLDGQGNSPRSITQETVTNNLDGSTDVYICFGATNGSGSQLSYDVSYACTPCAGGGTAGTTMDLGYRIGDGTCSDNCLISIACESATTQLSSCGCGPCTGMNPVVGTVTRACFGAPDNDNDGCADTGGTIDRSRVCSDRALPGDELAFVSKAIVNIAGTEPQQFFDYVYLELNFPNPHALGSANTLEIYDASAGVRYTTCTPNVFITPDDLSAKYYLTTGLLQSCGDIPSDFVYEQGDSVIILGTFVNANNPGCQIDQVNIDMDWYAGFSEDPEGADQLSCNDIPVGYQQVG